MYNQKKGLNENTIVGRRSITKINCIQQGNVHDSIDFATNDHIVANLNAPECPNNYSSIRAYDPKISFLLLNGVAILWGSQHIVIKTIVETFPSTSLVNFWRFATSAILFSPSLLTIAKSEKRNEILKAGLELGLYTFLGFAFQSIGLETTTATRSAFLLYLNVKFVPFLAFCLLGRSISMSTISSALLAFTGTVLLSTDTTPPNIGDLWCIAAAFASALFILRLENFANLFKAGELNSVSFLTVAVLCAGWLFGDIAVGNVHGILNISDVFDVFAKDPLPIIYLGVVTTGLCNFLQTIGQRSIPAEKASIIYSMDPLYAAVFSNVFLQEQIGINGYLGASCILLGVIIAAFMSFRPITIERGIGEKNKK